METIITQLVLLLLISESFLLISHGRVLNTLPYLESLRQTSTADIQRQGNLDLVRLTTNETLRFCHLVDFNRHTVPDRSDPDRLTAFGTWGLEGIAAVSLALEHLNTGDGRVVQEVHGLNNTCGIRFTAEFHDTEGRPDVAVDQLIQVLSRSEDNGESLQPCAFLGALSSEVSVATALLTSLKGYPQLSASSQSSQLDDGATFPLFGRTTPSNDNFAGPLLSFLSEQLQVSHLAVLHTDSAYGTSYLTGVRDAAATLGENVMTLQTVGFPEDATDCSTVVASLKSTGFRYFLAVMPYWQFPNVIQEAYAQGIAGSGDHVWIVSNSVYINFKGTEFSKDDPFFLATKGLLQYTTVGSLSGVGRYNEFVQAFQEFSMDERDGQYLQTKIPPHPESPAYNPQYSAEIFESFVQSTRVSLWYDATIALGLAACSAVADSVSAPDLSGTQHYTEVLKNEFVAASGTVKLDPGTGSRDASSALFVLANYVEEPDTSDTSGNVTLVPVQTHYFNGQWFDADARIVFNDGTTTVPLDLPLQQITYNYIGTAWRVGGLVMAGIVICSSIAFTLWTHLCRNTFVVNASQPIFLEILCLGCASMGASIIPLSIDDEVANTQKGIDVACMTFPWLLFLGWCVAFSALYTKTSRINRIFHAPRFQRVTVSPVDVMKPMGVLLSANLLILILWTLLDPLQWVREVDAWDVYNRPSESSAICTSDHHYAFVIPLLVVNICPLLIAIQQAYVARKSRPNFQKATG